MIHWRVRTEYSFGQTFAPIGKIVAHLKAQGCTAAAIVDAHGTWGHVPWYKGCVENSVLPLLGVELAVSNEEDEASMMAFIARNPEGLKELYGFTTHAHTQSLSDRQGKIPRLFKTDVLGMSENVMKLAGEMLDEKFLVRIGAIIDLSPASRVVNAAKRAIADRNGLRVVNCCDNAYVEDEDKKVLEIIAPRSAKPSPQDLHDPLDDSTDLLPEAFPLPKAPLIKVADAQRKLRALCKAGVKYREKLNSLVWDDSYQERLDYELELIKEKDFASYFLVVADMCAYAKEHMLVGPSRGSAAGSLVCWLTRITEIDPLPPKLMFERFIDRTREDLPDIDLDFPDAKRHMVFDYMAEKYGAENVAHIGTITRYKAKSALVAACKRMRVPPQATVQVKIAMIERSSADARVSDCLLDTLNTTEPGKKLKQMYPEVMIAAKIEGHAAHTGVHAAGLLVCNEPISNFCTVTELGIAQIEKYSAEKLGLLKIDVLGLRTLSVLDGAGVLSNDEWYAMPLDDQATFDIFDSQALSGIFQFEGDAMRDISKRMVPFTSMHDIDAVTALARPGPFASGITERYLKSRNSGHKVIAHPLVEEHMRNTHGLPIYQEQTLAIVRNIGNFSWTDSANIRRLISRRMGTEYFDTFWQKFRDGAMANGLPENDAREIWASINTMGSWQMNKAHTYSYAVLSYWCAWLKAHHPLPFVLSCLRSGMDTDKGIKLIREMVVAGRIQHCEMDWRVADVSWSIQDGKLMPGLDSAKGFGPKLSEKFIESRAKGTLSAAMIAKIENAEKEFDHLFPIETQYGDYYNGKMNIVGGVQRIKDLTGEQDGSFAFIGKLIYKSLRDINEDILVKRRDGKVHSAPLIFLDIRIQDDTDQILARINRFDYLRMGEQLFSSVEMGATLLVRAKFMRGFRFGFITKWKRIDVE